MLLLLFLESAEVYGKEISPKIKLFENVNDKKTFPYEARILKILILKPTE